MGRELAHRQGARCRLAAAAGRERICPEAACAFWEPGGAVVAGRCALEQVDLDGRPEIATALLDLRDRLDDAPDERAWHDYHRLLNESREE